MKTNRSSLLSSASPKRLKACPGADRVSSEGPSNLWELALENARQALRKKAMATYHLSFLLEALIKNLNSQCSFLRCHALELNDAVDLASSQRCEGIEQASKALLACDTFALLIDSLDLFMNQMVDKLCPAVSLDAQASFGPQVQDPQPGEQPQT